MAATTPPFIPQSPAWTFIPQLPVWMFPADRREPTIQPAAPLEPAEKEPTPPIPSELVGRECLYGFVITEDIVNAHTANASTAPLDLDRRREITQRVIYTVARRLGLNVHIDEPRGHDDIAWFSYTKGGVVKIKYVPIASSLDSFATELGITQKPAWHDAWVNPQYFALHCP
ncbi:hypothetical protein C8F01DRAFT_1242345 [Mycena amicta]|nr:hypothetical protein C8F01DRAFT_1242345 [Mycena amicta]